MVLPKCSLLLSTELLNLVLGYGNFVFIPNFNNDAYLIRTTQFLYSYGRADADCGASLFFCRCTYSHLRIVQPLH